MIHDTASEWPIQRNKSWHPSSASIIINNFNYGSFVRKAIESALAQTHTAQIIVVDDGSTDNSREIIASYDNRIETVFKKNGGHASAFNAGFLKANGDIVMFLDSDDMMEPVAVETLFDLWRPDTAVAHYPMTTIDKDGNPKGSIPAPQSRLADGDVRSELLLTGYFPSTVTSGMAFARTVLDRIMPVPEEEYFQGADGYLLRAAAFFGPFQYVDKRLARYRIHDRNDSNPWGARRTIVAGFRHRIKLERNFLETTRQFAKRFQMPISAGLGDGNITYVGSRLFSLVLEPNGHPVKSDRRSTLLRHYLATCWKQELPAPRRIMQIAVATLSVIGGRRTATVLIRWMGDSTARPAWFKAVANWIRNRQYGQQQPSQTV